MHTASPPGTPAPAAYDLRHEQRDTLLLLSFADRDALASDLTDAGFRVVAARRTHGLIRRFLALDCDLIVLDARSAIDQALAAAQSLAGHAAAREARLLLLYDRADAEQLAPFAACGISAMLPAPWHREELSLAIALARRQARPAGQAPRPVGQTWWTAALADGVVRIDRENGGVVPEFVDSDRFDGRGLLRGWPRQDRVRAFRALHQLLRQGGYAAFSHHLDTAFGRVALIHHLSLDAGTISGHTEWHIVPDADTGVDPAVNAGRLPTLAEGLRLLRLSGPGELRHAIAMGCAVKGAAALRAELGDAAASALVEHLAHSLAQALRRDFAHGVTLCADKQDEFALLVTHEDGPDRVEMEARLTARAIERTLLQATHRDMQLLLAIEKHVGDRPPPAVAAGMDRQLRDAVTGRVQMELPANLALGQVEVRFQPQFHVASGTIAGAEVLARWHHPRLGTLGGATLVAAAIASGQHRELSRHVWASAMQSMARWPASMQHLKIALNATPADIDAPDAANDLLALAAQCGINAARVTVEVTEGMAIDSPQAAAQTLRTLRAAGMHVALDDFGTGFSGLAWLRQLPVDYIKVDAAFTRDAADTERAAKLLQGIVEHVRTQGVDVLAEGVEDEEQLAMITALGCRWYQGYLRASAMTAADFEQFVAAHAAR